MERKAVSWERVLFWAVVLGAAAIRVVDLNLKPLHSDESVNGWFMSRLLSSFHYRYNPTDYHGPLLYFANYLPMKLFGANELTLRIATATAGTGAVASMALFRRWIGAWGVVVAAALMAVSAPDVYFSRTCIHEVWLVLFTSLGVAALLNVLQRGSALSFVGAALAWAGAFATKETVVLSGAAVGMGILVAALPFWKDDEQAWLPVGFRGWPGWLLAHKTELVLAGSAAMLGVGLLFTSFLTWPPGLVSMVQAFIPIGERGWVQYGVTGRNQGKGPGYFWGLWVWWAPVLFMAFWGLVLGIARRDRFAVFTTVWFLVSLASYELIPYKTPWCALQIGLPLFLLAGSGAKFMVDWSLAPLRWAGALLSLALLLWTGAEGLRQSWDTCFLRYDSTRVPFVYVQTRRAFMRAPADLWALRKARKETEGEGAETRLFGVEAKNPLRWYLVTRGWPKNWIGFRNKWPDDDDSETLERVAKRIKEAAIIIVAQKWERKIGEIVDTDEYIRRTYQDRPGKVDVAFYRKDVATFLPPRDAPLLDGGGDLLRATPEGRAPILPIPSIKGVDPTNTLPARMRKKGGASKGNKAPKPSLARPKTVRKVPAKAPADPSKKDR